MGEIAHRAFGILKSVKFLFLFLANLKGTIEQTAGANELAVLVIKRLIQGFELIALMNFTLKVY